MRDKLVESLFARPMLIVGAGYPWHLIARLRGAFFFGSVVLIYYGLAIIFGKVNLNAFANRSSQVCFGLSLLLLAFGLLVLMIKFPHR